MGAGVGDPAKVVERVERVNHPSALCLAPNHVGIEKPPAGERTTCSEISLACQSRLRRPGTRRGR
jgi:hypothetical protein